MLRHRSILARLLFSMTACVLVCAVSASEIPEHLTLTNDTSNDYILRSPTTPKTVQSLSAAKVNPQPFASSVPPHTRSQVPAVSGHGTLSVECDLLILLSVLRT